MNRKFLYCLSILLITIAGWVILKNTAARNSQTTQLISPEGNTFDSDNETQRKETVARSEGKSKEVQATNPNNSASSAPTGGERNSMPTIIKLKFSPVELASFIAKENTGSGFWNKPHTFHLIELAAGYDLYDREGKKIFEFPRFINADPGGNPKAIDRLGKDIEWHWVNDYSVIGVEQIIQERRTIPLTVMDVEFPEILPDVARIYLYDVKKTDVVYELLPPIMPAGFVARIEGISEEGLISLAAVSSKAYNRGGDLKNDPNHYKYLGVFSFKK